MELTIKFSPMRSIALIALGLAVVIDVTFWRNIFSNHEPQGLIFFVLQTAWIVALVLAARAVQKELPRTGYIAGGFALAASLAPFFTSSEVGLGLALQGLFLSNVLLMIAFFNQTNIATHFYDALNWFIVHPIERFFQGIIAFFELMEKVWRSFSTTGRAIVIGIPVALIITLLLSAIDPTLRDLLQAFFDALPRHLIVHLFLIAFMSCAILVMLLPITLASFTSHAQQHTQGSNIAWHTVLITVCAPLVLFTILHTISYLRFMAQDSSLDFAVNAQQGVIEACVATFLCGIMLVLAWAKTKQEQQALLNIPSIVMLATLVILTCVAQTKVIRYIAEFGFTPTRIAGMLSILALLAMVVIGGWLLVVKKDSRKALITNGVILFVFLTATPLLQLDALSARLNIMRATNGIPLDTQQLFKLSDEAVPLLAHALTQELPQEGTVTCTKIRRIAASFEDTKTPLLFISIPDMITRNAEEQVMGIPCTESGRDGNGGYRW